MSRARARTCHPRRHGLPASASAVLALTIVTLAARAQDAPSSRPADERTLAARQQSVRERLDRLESTMSRLRQLLGETEPESAEKLRDAIDHSARLRIRARLGELVALLQASQFSPAEQRQGEVLADLEATLRILTETLGDLDRKRLERERMEQTRKAIRALIEEQTDILQRTKDAAAERARADALHASAEALEKLAERQRQWTRTIGQPGMAHKPEMIEEQKAIERDARSIAEELKGLDRSNDPVNERGEAAAQAAQDVERAADSMRSAGAESQPDAKSERGRSAESDLRKAVERLRKEADELKKKDSARELEKRQRQAERKAEEVEKGMKPGESGGRTLPGAEGVQRARQDMQRSADRLGENDPSQAEQPQAQSIDELQESLDELEDALRQMRQEEAEETLAALEVRLRAILTREESVRGVVVDLGLKGPANWGRAEQLALIDAAQWQVQAADDCAAVQRILVEEGTTVIIPEIVGQLAATTRELAAALQRNDTSPRVQSALGDVIETLQELLEIVEKKRDEMKSEQNQPQPGQEPGQEQQPLLPPSAELKLLRSRQIRVNRETEALAAEGAAADQFERIAAQERRLAELARKLNEKD